MIFALGGLVQGFGFLLGETQTSTGMMMMMMITRRDGAGAGAGGAALPGAGLSALHSLPRPHLPLPRHQVEADLGYI